MSSPVQTGGCLCGAVRYQVVGELRDVMYCHCEQCRRTSGHFVAATAAKSSELQLIESDGLRWYSSSSTASRGFCHKCGASLFWKTQGRDAISIMAGTLDLPTNLVASSHIFTGSAADYYDICDGLPQFIDYETPADCTAGSSD